MSDVYRVRLTVEGDQDEQTVAAPSPVIALMLAMVIWQAAGVDPDVPIVLVVDTKDPA